MLLIHIKKNIYSFQFAFVIRWVFKITQGGPCLVQGQAVANLKSHLTPKLSRKEDMCIEDFLLTITSLTCPCLLPSLAPAWTQHQ